MRISDWSSDVCSSDLASSLYFAVNLNRYGETEDRYASILAPTLYRHRGTVHGYGLKFWPGSFEQLQQIERHLQAPDPLMQSRPRAPASHISSIPPTPPPRPPARPPHPPHPPPTP